MGRTRAEIISTLPAERPAEIEARAAGLRDEVENSSPFDAAAEADERRKPISRRDGRDRTLRGPGPAPSRSPPRRPGHATLPAISHRLKTLERQLLALSDDAMILSEFDGFIAGLIVCPELITPHEWLPRVWGEMEDGEGPVFESQAQIDSVFSGIMAHYNAVADTLHSRPGHYQPIFDVDERHDEILWETWARGFSIAVNLRPDAWSELLQADDDHSTALILLMTMGAIADAESPLSGGEVETITSRAPEIIPELVERLNAWRLGRFKVAPSGSARAGKIGRNDPCPCGSGKKYKKCCGVS